MAASEAPGELRNGPRAVRTRVAAVIGTTAVIALGMVGVGVASAGTASARTVSARAQPLVAVGVGLPAAPSPSIASSCPPAPKAPPQDAQYARTGDRWNPARTITYKVDTANVPASQVARRVADVKRAIGAAHTYTGFRFHYGGTERTLADPSSSVFLVQFEIVANLKFHGAPVPVLTTTYHFNNDATELAGATIAVTRAATLGYGSFDAKQPLASPEGHELLFGTAAALGLAPVKDTYREVMNRDISSKFYFESYQAGDKRGLWEIGASKGCSGFKD